MKRVLIGIPTARSVDALCLAGVIDTLTNSTVAEFRLETVMGCYVNVNRNKIVDAAKDGGFDEVLMVDSDMAVTREHIERLLSHDVDIVGAVYCKRKEGPPEWLYHCNPDAKVDERGLFPVNDVGTGVIRVRMAVFKKLEIWFPCRRYKNHDGIPRHEYFPIGTTGPNSAEGRLQEIEEVLARFPNDHPAETHLWAIQDIVRRGAPRPDTLGPLGGEDTRFCHDAAKCGFQVWADNEVVVPHLGTASFPRP